MIQHTTNKRRFLPALIPYRITPKTTPLSSDEFPSDASTSLFQSLQVPWLSVRLIFCRKSSRKFVPGGVLSVLILILIILIVLKKCAIQGTSFLLCLKHRSNGNVAASPVSLPSFIVDGKPRMALLQREPTMECPTMQRHTLDSTYSSSHTTIHLFYCLGRIRSSDRTRRFGNTRSWE